MLIVVQRGHCFRTTGATGAPGEQSFTKAAADKTALHLRMMGHSVRIINADVANDQYLGDLFVAIHYDSSNSQSARGASVGWQTPEGNRFGQAWKRAYAAAGWSGGFRGDNYTEALGGYYGVRRAVSVGNRRAIIVEAGFHSSPADAQLLAAPAGPDRVGRAIAAAVAEVVGGTPPPLPTPAPIPEVPDMFLYTAPNSPVFFCHAGQSVGLNEASDVPTFAAADVPKFDLDDDTFAKFRARFPGA